MNSARLASARHFVSAVLILTVVSIFITYRQTVFQAHAREARASYGSLVAVKAIRELGGGQQTVDRGTIVRGGKVLHKGVKAGRVGSHDLWLIFEFDPFESNKTSCNSDVSVTVSAFGRQRMVDWAQVDFRKICVERGESARRVWFSDGTEVKSRGSGRAVPVGDFEKQQATKLREKADELGVKPSESSTRTFRRIDESWDNKSIEVPGLPITVTNTYAGWSLAVLLLVTLVSIRTRIAPVLKATEGFDEPWLLLDARSPLERGIAGALLGVLILSPWVVNGALVASIVVQQNLGFADWSRSLFSWLLTLPVVAISSGLALRLGGELLHLRRLARTERTTSTSLGDQEHPPDKQGVDEPTKGGDPSKGN